MRIGPEHWMCVTPDTAGVPTGGRWGNPGWFGKQMKKIGLTLCWSRMHGNFGIMRRIAPARWVWQMHCRRGGVGTDPVPLGGELLKLVVALWNMAKGSAHVDKMRGLQRARARELYDQAVERQTFVQDAMPEVLDYTKLVRGYRGPRIVMPMSPAGKPVGLRRDFHAAQRRKVRRRRIHQPGEVN